ncbi:zinc finger MYM-type protein 1-like [Xenia sp. Carnegie-2017]|uniref:zinc finger MYM-type protein 1-like n=1 Tax=Xenia sp. Carnegie-2017 TaxID=2897299 RepID=UPI001F040007|nr:zinc finger MYM-type protein 1-like [Xenia sp. Carnegie-2017]
MTECIVESLLSRSFGLRPFSEKREIVEGGRPTPELQGLHTTSKRSGKVFIRSFQTSNYDKYKWLAGSSKLNKLFCWPCLLFNSTDKTVWCKKGYDDLANLCNAVNRHEKTKTHLSSCLMNASFGRTRIDMQLDEQARQHISAHKNIEVLCRFIDVVCFLGKQELSFRGRVELEESANRGNYVELIKLLSAYDPTLEQHLHTTTVFSGLSNRIQNDLIVAVKDVMLKAIKDEVMRSPFVAISLDEISDVKTLSQLTTIVGYVNPVGKAVERFLGFTDVSEDRTAARLKQEVGKTLNEYGCGEKLIAQTYDGASVMSGELSGLQTRLSRQLKSVVYFLKPSLVFHPFFHASSKRTYLLDTVVGRRIPTGTAVRWHYQSRLIHAVLETRAKLLEVFEYIIENDDEFDGTTLNEARGYRQVLADFQFVFCLKIFSEIFGLTDVLYNIIQSKQFDIVFCVTKVRETKDKIQEQRTKFVDYWNFTSSIVKVALKRGQSEEDTTLTIKTPTSLLPLRRKIMDDHRF